MLIQPHHDRHTSSLLSRPDAQAAFSPTHHIPWVTVGPSCSSDRPRGWYPRAPSTYVFLTAFASTVFTQRVGDDVPLVIAGRLEPEDQDAIEAIACHRLYALRAPFPRSPSAPTELPNLALRRSVVAWSLASEAQRGPSVPLSNSPPPQGLGLRLRGGSLPGCDPPVDEGLVHNVAVCSGLGVPTAKKWRFSLRVVGGQTTCIFDHHDDLAQSPAAPWDVAGTLGNGSESTLRRRRDEWLAAGVFATLLAEAIAAYDRVIELRRERGRPQWQPAQSAHGRRGNRPEPESKMTSRVERAKVRWKWSVLMTADASCGCRKLGSPCDLVLRGALSAGRLAGWV
jgi:hypothetical protein